MSALTDKIKDIRDQEVRRTMSEEYRRAVWKLLIAFGGISVASSREFQYDYQRQDAEWNYYAARPNLDLAATKRLLLEDKWDLIDWDELDDPAQHIGYGFCGAFTSSQLKVPYLKGMLKFKDGTEYLFVASVAGDEDSFARLQRALQLDITMDEAVEHLRERTTHFHGTPVSEWTFSYSAGIDI
jgi:hypothetical protein